MIFKDPVLIFDPGLALERPYPAALDDALALGKKMERCYPLMALLFPEATMEMECVYEFIIRCLIKK